MDLNRAGKRIRQLPQQIADRIAAGEVVDRPVSIVKELVENSIDAGSTSLVVEIRNGGKTYIRVTDNGSGIAAEDAELAFLRHATSKIRTASDLDGISTLGFRGEALASIAAVARVELVTRTEEDRTGTYLLMEGGQLAERSEKGAPVGTTLVVRDLFYNTPARMKFLKNDNVESARIIDLISKIALAYPQIRVRMINNGNTLFSTPGRGDRLTAIATVYDPNMAKKLIGVEGAGEQGLHLEGYISSPEQTRPNRKSQIFFVNGRYIQSRLLEECVSEAYRARMFEGRFPIAFLFLEVDPFLTDVNIHPNKREIRFDDETVIRSFVTETLKKALAIPEAVPEIHFRQERRQAPAEGGYGSASEGTPEKKAAITEQQEQLDIRKILRNRRADQETKIRSRAEVNVPFSESGSEEKAELTAGRAEGSAETSGVREQESTYQAGGACPGNVTVSPEKDAAGPETGTLSSKNGADTLKNSSSSLKNGTASENAPFRPAEPERVSGAFDIGGLRPIGIIFREYILCEDGEAFYMIDQHAAHERVFYEQFIDAFYGSEPARQVLMLPITLNTSLAAGSLSENWMRFLNASGFAVEEFGARTFIAREIPAYMDLKEAEEFLEDFTENVEKAGSFRDQRRVDRIITKACKAAVKANDALNDAEVAKLLKDLAKCRNPFSCPHGRPTVIRMTHSEIDRLFKR